MGNNNSQRLVYTFDDDQTHRRWKTQTALSRAPVPPGLQECNVTTSNRAQLVTQRQAAREAQHVAMKPRASLVVP